MGAASPDRPNILFMFADQWRYDWTGLGHNAQPAAAQLPFKLPTLESLAQQGVRFERAYAAAPVCAPSRAALASGREYDAGQVHDNSVDFDALRISTFYRSLLRAGYHTMTAGKDDLNKGSFLGMNKNMVARQVPPDGRYMMHDIGFADGIRCLGKQDLFKSSQPRDPYSTWLSRQGIRNASHPTAWGTHRQCFQHPTTCTSVMFQDMHYQDNWITAQALTLLKRRPRDRPYFIQVNYAGPHPPFYVTEGQYANVVGMTMPSPVGVPDQDAIRCNPLKSFSFEGMPNRCSYAASIINLDAQFGRLMEYVRADDPSLAFTLVAFASDHGEMLGDHHAQGKNMPWEVVAAVPLIIAGVSVTRGAVARFPVALIDLGATFVDYARAAPLPNATSLSLRRVLESDPDPDSSIPLPSTGRQYIFSGAQSWKLRSPRVRTKDVAWRMVIEVASGLKLVCCLGYCPGAPLPMPNVDMTTGFQQGLFNLTADWYDLHAFRADAHPTAFRHTPLVVNGSSVDAHPTAVRHAPLDAALPYAEISEDLGRAAARLRSQLPTQFHCGARNTLRGDQITQMLAAQKSEQKYAYYASVMAKQRG
jgi:arylsulfatase